MTADAVGGVFTYALELIEALETHGFVFELACMGAKLSESQWQRARSIPNLAIHESSFKLEWMEHAAGDVRDSGAWLLELARAQRPDLVHLNGYAHGQLDFDCPRLIVAHSCVYSWWKAVLGGQPGPSWREYFKTVRSGLESVDFLAAPTRAMLKEIEAIYGPLTCASRVVPNGIPAQPEAAAEKEDFVIAAGRLWDKAKNLRALDAAADRLSWPVFAAGNAHSPEADTLPFRNLHALGELSYERLQGCLAAASIFAHPALYEPFGLSVLEAARAGCALVLGDIESLRENWEGAAVFVPPRDADAIRDAIEGLIRDERERHRLGAAARSRSKNFTADAMAADYSALYRELVMQKEARCA